MLNYQRVDVFTEVGSVAFLLRLFV
jgi:hypothetical protein